jgi:hypothetical protein
VARGQYNVEVYLLRDGEVVSAQSTPLFIDQTGIERRLFNLALQCAAGVRPDLRLHGHFAGLDFLGAVPPAGMSTRPSE